MVFFFIIKVKILELKKMVIMIFGAHVNIVFIKKVKILELIECSYRSSQLC